MQGKIIRGIAGFYYVHVEEIGILECKAKGIFRNDKLKPLVGDNVDVDILDDVNMTGNITKILKRKNALIRPAVANVDQAVIIFAVSFPKPNLNLLDRFLLMMQTQDVSVSICFNKTDDAESNILDQLEDNYKNSGSSIYRTSAVTGEGIDELQKGLISKTTVFAGPSGVGKSSLMNRLFPDADIKTGEISDKIKRGKHTTRHSELYSLGNGIYVMDTPGFTSLRLPDIEKEEVKNYYREFDNYQGECRFLGCVHVSEPDCAIKSAVEEEEISRTRYENYRQFYEEIKQTKKY